MNINGDMRFKDVKSSVITDYGCQFDFEVEPRRFYI